MITLWERILSELAKLQDAAPPRLHGSVVNAVTGAPCVIDGCCAAAVFAAEYRRTGTECWRTRADGALASVLARQVFRGAVEPMWAGDGWRDVPDSLPATGIALDAYLDALTRLERTVDENCAAELSSLLRRCRTKAGGFAHNTVPADENAPEVQNATASALNLLVRIPSGHLAPLEPLYEDLDAALGRLERGQSGTGFWPYTFPSALRKLIERAPLDRLSRSLPLPLGGDIMHHLMTLYFASGYFVFSSAGASVGMLADAWRWVTDRLQDDGNGGLAIDWSGERVPRFARSSNARDTNAYFLAAGAVPRLASLGVIDGAEAELLTEGLFRHIVTSLLGNSDHVPCVAPCEGPPAITAKILPMFEQSVAWKGSLMAGLVLEASG